MINLAKSLYSMSFASVMEMELVDDPDDAELILEFDETIAGGAKSPEEFALVNALLNAPLLNVADNERDRVLGGILRNTTPPPTLIPQLSTL